MWSNKIQKFGNVYLSLYIFTKLLPTSFLINFIYMCNGFILFDNIFNIFEFKYIKLAICDFWYLLLFHELTWRIFLKIMEINYLCSMLKVNKSKSTSVAFILNSVDILKIWCQNTIKFKSSILEARLWQLNYPRQV